ncbi:MAG: flavin-dependent dehydrogenase [Cellvibrionaceae bacterium]|jgi:flavin-dependent dehydrogenase
MIVETMKETHYDIVIVGGRPAGASLAARLGQLGIKTLIVERATFPSGAAVSTPFVFGHTMALLDEIGADEGEYAANTPEMRRFVLEFKDYFRTFFPVATVGKRDYMYTVNRVKLDTCLWNQLERFETVTAVANFAVTGVVTDHQDRVTGITGRHPQQKEITITADCVVGADGRYSTIAKKVGAQITEQRTDVDTDLFYAYWEGVADYDEQGDVVPHIHTSIDGFSYVFMPSADGQISVIAQGQSDLYQALEGSPQEVYIQLLQKQPHVWRRLKGAKQVTKLSGIRRMGNMFRQATGPGWALTGDAYHQKDSIDAQGIYDALLMSKLLAEELGAWKKGDKDWKTAMADYESRSYADLKPTFDGTTGRVQREIYDIPPEFVAKNILRWILTSKQYQHGFSQMLIRQYDPAGLSSPPAMLKMLGAGIGTDIKRLFSSDENVNVMPPAESMPQ